MDFENLRRIVRPLVIALSGYYTHAMLPEVCQDLGLPDPNFGGSKRERMTASFDELTDVALPSVAIRFLELHLPSPSDRNLIEDLLWVDLKTPAISKKCRREVARALRVENLYVDQRRFESLLERLWVVGTQDPMAAVFGGEDNSLRTGIDRHIYGHSGIWSVEEFFDQLGALDSSDRRFVIFLEGLASADVRKDEDAQREFVKVVNKPLNKCGVELRETDTADGYPVFTIVSTRNAAPGRPKNLIFASPVKPDLRFKDALNNDIEIVTNVDKVLVYDRPIGVDGLRWCDLQAWWAESQRIPSDEKAKKTLYLRLRGCLPSDSPPQTLLFDAFYKGFGIAVPELPALLPEVWLHWDPKTVEERGVLALTRFRMDFLLLLPHGNRVVIEVDGKGHYARANGQVDVGRYALMASADRDLKLAGYEVFHFGAEELRRSDASKLVKAFFVSLFKRYSVGL